jgi:hypothetical protein
MTAPVQPVPVEAPEEQTLLDAESLAYELGAEAAVTTGLALAVQAVLAAATATFAAAAILPPIAFAAVLVSWRNRTARQLRAIDPRMGKELTQQVQRGILLGWAQAAGPRRPAPERILLDDPELRDVLATVDQRALDQLERAARYAESAPMTDPGDVASLVGIASRTVQQARQDTRWAANRAVNAGTTKFAEMAGLRRVWVAERDACLHCLAYSGQVADAKGRFPAGLTFAKRALKMSAEGYLNPPAHPNCRCRVWPYDGEGPRLAADVPDADIATALAREARRSVLRGWSAYAGQGERLGAAERLLFVGANLPKTVQRRAARDIARGEFSQRHVPRTNLQA